MLHSEMVKCKHYRQPNGSFYCIHCGELLD